MEGAMKSCVPQWFFFVLIFVTVGADHECGRVGGTCMLDEYQCDGVWADDMCLGSRARKCCVHPKYIKDRPLEPDCKMQDGVCQEESNQCHGKYVANLCNGPPSRKCCIEDAHNPFHHRTPPTEVDKGLALVDADDLELDRRWRDVCGLQGEGAWPWEAELKPSVEGHCSAVLIAPNWLLTAASCFKKFKKSKEWTVLLGKTHLMTKGEFEQSYKVSRVFLHSQHGIGQASHHDLALIKLKSKSALDVSHINAICTPTSDMSFENDECHILGWGSKDRTGLQDDKLQDSIVDVYGHKMCSRRVWGISRGQICTTNNKDITCKMDAGSPLVCKHGDKFYIAGIAVDNQCEDKLSAAVFTRVPFYLDWIYMNTRNNDYE